MSSPWRTDAVALDTGEQGGFDAKNPEPMRVVLALKIKIFHPSNFRFPLNQNQQSELFPPDASRLTESLCPPAPGRWAE